MKTIDENTVKTVSLIVELATIIANGVKSIIGIFRKKKKDGSDNAQVPEGDA